MCVIFIVEEERPTVEMVADAWKRNPQGGGVAWQADGLVHWKKDLGLVGMQEMAQTLPFPFVMHFRIASVGGVRPDLTHPFEVSKNPSTELEGTTENTVLFHNGDWKSWQDMCLDAAIRSGVPIPDGEWSDSRAMGWLGSIYGPGLFNFIKDQRLVAFGPQHIGVYGYGWKEINKVWCSNDYFMPVVPVQQQGGRGWSQVGGGVCLFGQCRENAIVGSRYCLTHNGHESDWEDEFCAAEGCVLRALHNSLYCWKHREEALNKLSATEDPEEVTPNQRSPLEQRLIANIPRNPMMIAQLAEEHHKLANLGTNAMKRVKKAVESFLAGSGALTPGGTTNGSQGTAG